MAVYTEVSDDELAAFVDSYGLGELMSYKGIAEGVENTNYMVRTSQDSFILTLYEKRVAHADLPFFLTLMEHLAARGLPSPTPVRDRDGRNLRRLAGRPAALITFREGFWVRRPSPAHCAALGESLAQLHMAGTDFAMTRANALSLEGWEKLNETIGRDAERVMPGLSDLMAGELELLSRAWPAALPEGVIHGDLFPDNVFFLGQRISGLIDFYFACNDMLAYDIAICLNAWCFETPKEFNITKAKAMLDAYGRIRALTGAEYDALPLLARGAALRFLLTRVHDWLHTAPSTFVKPHDPTAYLDRLRFHQGVETARGYGLEAPA